jgi:hypothetical protein
LFPLHLTTQSGERIVRFFSGQRALHLEYTHRKGDPMEDKIVITKTSELEEYGIEVGSLQTFTTFLAIDSHAHNVANRRNVVFYLIICEFNPNSAEHTDDPLVLTADNFVGILKSAENQKVDPRVFVVNNNTCEIPKKT